MTRLYFLGAWIETSYEVLEDELGARKQGVTKYVRARPRPNFKFAWLVRLRTVNFLRPDQTTSGLCAEEQDIG